MVDLGSWTSVLSCYLFTLRHVLTGLSPIYSEQGAMQANERLYR